MPQFGKTYDETAYQASRAPELITTFQDKFTQARLLHAELLDLVADMDQEGIVGVTGYSKLAHLLAEAVRITPQHARKLVDQAGAVAQSLTPTGHTTPAPMPHVRDALREGVIGGEHLEEIAKFVKLVPDTAPLGTKELVESTLAEAARDHDPLAVREQGVELLRHVDPDGTQPSEDELAEPKNTFTFRRHLDGTMTFRGQVERETAELFEGLLDKESQPQTLDTRTKRQRLGDAVCELIYRAANPDGEGRTLLAVHLDLNALTDHVATTTLASGCHLAPSVVRRMCCDGEFLPLVLNGHSVPLDAGTTRRLVNPKQREALVARDRGCAYPGCTAPARWAEAHHIKHWKDGGPTDLANLVLLCRRHHRVLHHSPWQVRMRDGLPEFIPPTWIDPAQAPRRNTVRHPRP